MTPPRTGLLDTSTVILMGRLSDDSALPQEPMISSVTLAELSVGPLVATTDAQRAARLAHLQAAEADFEPLPFGTEEARAFARVAADLRAHGRKPSARAFDAMIAATAVAGGLPLHTCDPGDFRGIRELDVVTVPHPDA